MNKYKVCVYAICKNEEKHIKRWYESMKEANEIFVLDTGSTDNSYNLLKELGVHVIKKDINPFRFDIARNESLNLIPDDYDICVCTDFDEVFESGWRKKLEEIWQKDTDRIAYNYNWMLDKDNNPVINFYIEKIHSRNNYIWTHPVHEVLKYTGKRKENIITTDNITLNHYPDNSKSRDSYLPLLELSVKEDPNDDRNMHYLGREYMYHKKYNEAIDTLEKHLLLPTATWKDERAASMRFIARCYKQLNRPIESKMWLNLAIKEAPHLRDGYIELAILEYSLKEYNNFINNCLKALEIKTHNKTYINEKFSWDNTVYLLLSSAYFYKEDYKTSLKYANIALSMDKNNESIMENINIIKNKIEATS